VAAARRFAKAGYEATSTRQIAADARVDPALVRRFFGGKEELFTEVASAAIDPSSVVTAVTTGPLDQAGERLIRHYLALLGTVDQPGPLLGVIRSAVTSDHAAHVLRRFLAERILGRIARHCTLARDSGGRHSQGASSSASRSHDTRSSSRR